MGSAQQAAQQANTRSGFALYKDAEVQAMVLDRLGFRAGGQVVGQRPLPPKQFTETVTYETGTLARTLVGCNSFDVSCFPLMQALDPIDSLHNAMSVANRVQFTILPTLELMAAICTRILCCTRRLRKAGVRRLYVFGVEDITALLTASVALHLGIVLRQAVDLTKELIELRYAEDFTIVCVALSVGGVMSQASLQMPLAPMSTASDSLGSGERAYVLVDGMQAQLGDSWIADENGNQKDNIVEVCSIQLPESLNTKGSPLDVKAFRVTELFPKTICYEDFLSRGFKEPDSEAGLFHTHMWVLTPPKAPVPFLVPQICHSKGPYDLRMKADKALWGLHRLRDMGIAGMRSADDLTNPFKDEVIESLKDVLYNPRKATEAARMQRLIEEVLECCDGRAKKQLALLLKHSASLQGRTNGLHH